MVKRNVKVTGGIIVKLREEIRHMSLNCKRGNGLRFWHQH